VVDLVALHVSIAVPGNLINSYWQTGTLPGLSLTNGSHLTGLDLSLSTEFARLNLTYTVMSKRKLLQLVEQKLGQRSAQEWDPRESLRVNSKSGSRGALESAMRSIFPPSRNEYAVSVTTLPVRRATLLPSAV